MEGANPLLVILGFIFYIMLRPLAGWKHKKN